MSEYIPCLSFCVCVTSLRMVLSFKFVCKFQDVIVLFVCLALSNILHCVNVEHFLYPFLVEGYLGSFQVLATINNAAMNIVEQMSL